jgi:penicillin V acylase-like amidase (Ntn superfamily)
MKRSTVVAVIKMLAIILSLFFPLVNTDACTRMFWNTNGKAMVVGRNQDIYVNDQAIIYALPEGLNKNGGIKDNPAEWTSRYGSLAVQVKYSGVNRVIEGINTAGLGIHGLYLGATQYEKRDARKGVVVGQAIQFLLDNAATVPEALVLLYHTQVVPDTDSNFPGHIAVEDVAGDSAIVEFIAGQMKVWHGSQYTVLTNDPPFDKQIQNLQNYRYFGGDLPLPGDLDSKSRFVRASAFLSTLNDASFSTALKPDPIAIMFTAIRSLGAAFGAWAPYEGTFIIAWPTIWTVVSDLTHKAVYFSHNVAKTNYWIDMQKLHFQKGAPILSLKAGKPGLTGEVSRLFIPAK